jgi:transposase-like protein
MRKKKILICPHCGGSNLYYEAGLITGYKYHCKDCHYIGAFVIEKEIDLEELEK